MDFRLVSEYKPEGDQPEAIEGLTNAMRQGVKHSTLLGVTGSGKTFTIANVVANINCPTLVISHNKTLAAQLYSEFKSFFPDNAVEYFVSYYDYYQPEAYLPSTDTYIEKDLAINEQLDQMRLSATSALLSGRRDVLVVSSVSCLYGIGNPQDFHNTVIELSVGQQITRNKLLHMLVDAMYSRSEAEFTRGTFRVSGDNVDIHVAYGDLCYRITFWGNEIESLSVINPGTGQRISSTDRAAIFPANIFITNKSRIQDAIRMIQDDMVSQCAHFMSIGKVEEAKRLQKRTEYDLEMIRELGYCSGIENYSRYFDGRPPGSRPFCLLDYFPDDFLVIIDESHVTIPQIRAMYGGDRSRKVNLVDFGFRLPAAVDNRPLTFEEFDSLLNQTIYVSATPADYELIKSEGIVVEQVVRPTGLLDPPIDVRPTYNQIDDILEEVAQCTEKNERVLITTLTKRMAEEMSKYLDRSGVRSRYIHSDVDTIERIEILEGLRKGEYEVLVGVNLLREGLDIPEVSLVIIMDADKEGFLRSARSMTQTAGRAARNVNGRVIMYADKVTDSMNMTISETNRRREKQMEYNRRHGITPTQIVKEIKGSLKPGSPEAKKIAFYSDNADMAVAADPVMSYLIEEDIEKAIAAARTSMEEAARELDFLTAARYRDEMFRLQEIAARRNHKHP